MDQTIDVVIEPTGATKRALLFVCDNSHPIDPDVEAVVVHLKEVFERICWLWNEFPMQLPPLLRPDLPIITIKDVFSPPNFDELRQVAFEPNGRPIPLNDEKLSEIRRRGEFSVASANFPGQFHRWRLSVLLQKGTERGTRNLHNNLALALECLIIFSVNRFIGKKFSLRKSLHAYKKALTIFLEIIGGAVHTDTVNYDVKMREEKEKYLLADLVPADEVETSKLNEFAKYLANKRKSSYHSSASSHYSDKDEHVVILPNKFASPSNQTLDLVLFDSNISKMAKVRLEVLADTSIDRKLFYEIKRAVLEEAGRLNADDAEKFREACSSSLYEMLVSEYFNVVRTDEALKKISSTLFECLFENYRVRKITSEEVMQYHAQVNDAWKQTRQSLESEYPIRSLIRRWMRRREVSFRSGFDIDHVWTVVDNVLEKAKKEGLSNFTYFLERSLHFDREVEPILEKEYQNIKIPCRQFKFKTKIWFARNYIVKRRHKLPDLEEIEEKVETRFSDQLYSSSMESGTTTDIHVLEKNIVRNVTTKYPFWRWANCAHRYWAWSWNALFLFLIYIPWRSGFGIKALFWPTVFYPGYIVNSRTGVVFVKSGSKTHSFVSRFRALWRHVHKSRVRFESTTDSGFLSKNITRHFNVFWNYVIKGFFGSVVLILVNPIVCIVVSVAGVPLGLTAPLWMSVVILSHYVFCMLIYDVDSPYKYSMRSRNKISILAEMIIYRFLILGVGQTCLALTAGLVFFPISSLLITIFAYVRFGLRSFWDVIMYQVVIKRYGRIPLTDSFVARRVSGPGLSRKYVYQINIEQALVAVEHKIQTEELKSFDNQTKFWIDLPLREYKKFMNSIKEHCGLDGYHCLARNELRAQNEKLRKDLDFLIKQRTYELKNVDADGVLSKIRMSADDLAITLRETANLLKKHYPTRILSRLCDISGEAWWDLKNLTFQDWNGLAEQICSEVFSHEFLIPLDDKQERFTLDVKHINLSRYMDMLYTGEHKEDLDAAEPVFAHRRKRVLDLPKPAMPVLECMPFLWSESYSCFRLNLIKKGNSYQFGLPNLYNIASTVIRDQGRQNASVQI